MEISDRQERILQDLIEEYISTARPVSSELLEQRCHLGLSSATVRIEMQRLADMGYIFQPHTSAGRIPTNKGYRFFVNACFAVHNDKNPFFDEAFFEDIEQIKEQAQDTVQCIEQVSKVLAAAANNLVLIYLPDKGFIWKAGFKGVFQNPEFRETDCLEHFLGIVESLEDDIKEFDSSAAAIEVFIGKEKSILKSPDFSVVVSRAYFPPDGAGIFTILGPTRMSYERNIELASTLAKSFGTD